MTLHTFECGPVGTIGYLASCPVTHDAVLIDCPLDASRPVAEALARGQLTLRAIILTHGHWDHLGETAQLARQTGAEIMAHEEDLWMIERPVSFGFPIPPMEGVHPGRFLRDGDVVECGTLRFRVLHVPGHTRGHIALHEEVSGELFAGDVLFHGGIGRTDLPGGDYDILMHSITDTLCALPPGTIVHPGHGPATTIGEECTRNPFIVDWRETME